MTTSYATSLRMKELGFPQEGGEYYWVRNLFNENEVLHESALPSAEINFVLCRAFTLGELVRMIGENFQLTMNKDDCWVEWYEFSVSNTSPEDAAAQLAIELKVSGVIKFEKEG